MAQMLISISGGMAWEYRTFRNTGLSDEVNAAHDEQYRVYEGMLQNLMHRATKLKRISGVKCVAVDMSLNTGDIILSQSPAQGIRFVGNDNAFMEMHKFKYYAEIDVAGQYPVYILFQKKPRPALDYMIESQPIGVYAERGKRAYMFVKP